ncbi:MAG TPA: sulfatase-like hydrolase/transferase [Bryobacteraceae bacterium]|nr:sulfatase-like hydrolase/transferase [Bryobacteraceae bacterium]
MSEKPAEKVNVVLVAITGLRANRLGSYGRAQSVSPFLDSLAADGAVCESFLCSAVPAEASFAALASGQHPVSLGMASDLAVRELPFGTTLLPQVFLEAGYTTAAFDNLRRRIHWLGRGYEFYVDPGLRHGREATGQELNARVLPWLRTHSGEPFFLSLHYRELDTAAQAERYDRALRSTDEAIRELAMTLSDLRSAQKTLLVVLSTSGRAPTDGDSGLLDSAVRVPLLVRWPGRVSRGIRLKQMLQMHDVTPTVLEAAGLPIPSSLEGRSFWKLLTGEQQEGGCDRVFSVACGPQPAWSLRTAEAKYILSPGATGEKRSALYDLATDPKEERNIASDRPAVAAAMERELEDWVAHRLEESAKSQALLADMT